jgi:glucose-1-phosphate cytidylyltransferase
MKVLILCGGRGSRAHPLTAETPKPLLTVHDRPLLLHIMEVFAGQGFDDFVLSAGWRSHRIAQFAAELDRGWRVEVVDTGEGTGTAGRIERCRSRLGDRFLATYGDGLANVDLGLLLALHETRARAATMTVVPYRSTYGLVELGPGDEARAVVEKPQLADRWVNGGFFVFDARVFDRWSGTDLERQVLPALAAAGQLTAYRHTGFWRSVDTHKDVVELATLLAASKVPVGAEPHVSG